MGSICLENISLLKAVLTGARIVYSVFGRIAAASPTSDTMLLKVFWDSPISSRPSLADGNPTVMAHYSLFSNLVNFECLLFTRVRDEDLADQVDDAIGGDDVLLQHHLNAVDCQAVAIAADLYVAALGSLKH